MAFKMKGYSGFHGSKSPVKKNGDPKKDGDPKKANDPMLRALTKDGLGREFTSLEAKDLYEKTMLEDLSASNDMTVRSDKTRVSNPEVVKSKDQLSEERKKKKKREAYIKRQATKPGKSPVRNYKKGYYKK